MNEPKPQSAGMPDLGPEPGHVPDPVPAPGAVQAPSPQAEAVSSAAALEFSPASLPRHPPETAAQSRVLRWLPWLCLVLSLACLTWIYGLQERLRSSEQELARRQSEGLQQLVEARTMAKQAEAVSRDMAGKLSLLEARVAESALQRSQLEDLMQSMSRSRDENVLADVEAALRVAQQQSALTGSIDPLVSTLKQTEERLARVQQPRLERVRRAVLLDLDRVRAAGGVDLTALTLRLDEVARQVEELPLLAAQGPEPSMETRSRKGSSPTASPAPVAAAASGGLAMADDLLGKAQRLAHYVWLEVRQLVRLTKIDHPEAALLAPEQAIFLRENLRLRLLSARLSLLSRQFDVAQSDIKQAQALLERYFDRSSRRVVAAAELLKQTAVQSRAIEVPRPAATLTAIAAATAGR